MGSAGQQMNCTRVNCNPTDLALRARIESIDAILTMSSMWFNSSGQKDFDRNLKVETSLSPSAPRGIQAVSRKWWQGIGRERLFPLSFQSPLLPINLVRLRPTCQCSLSVSVPLAQQLSCYSRNCSRTTLDSCSDV